MITYAKEYRDRFGLIAIPEGMERRLADNPITPCSSTLSVDQCLKELRELRTIFRAHWTRMDAPRIALGLLLTFNALLALLVYDNGAFSLYSRSREELLMMAGTTLATLPTAFTLSPFVYIGLAAFTTMRTAVLLANGLQERQARPGVGTAFTGGLLVALTLSACSNSFVVQETRVLAFLLQSLLISAALSMVSVNGRLPGQLAPLGVECKGVLSTGVYVLLV